jgi:dCMP deaminase
MLINAGIQEIYYDEGYPDDLSLDMIEESKIKLTKLELKEIVRSEE